MQMKSLHYCALAALLCPLTLLATPIDRHALVARHEVVLKNFDANNPLSVGNGQFCFTVDATGLQTFPDAFTNTIPLGTLSDWGWHTAPNPNGMVFSNASGNVCNPVASTVKQNWPLPTDSGLFASKFFSTTSWRATSAWRSIGSASRVSGQSRAARAQ